MRYRTGLPILAASLLTSLALAQAQRPLREARSENRRFTLRIERGRPGPRSARPCRATLTERVRNSRQPKEAWKTELVNELAPVYASIRNDGRFVVTLDEFRYGGARHAVAIYGEDGRLRKEFRLDELLRTDDWRHVKVRRSAIVWLSGARFEFDDPQTQFVIHLKWDRQIRIDLEQLEIVGRAPEADLPEPMGVPPEILALLEASAAEEEPAQTSDSDDERFLLEFLRLYEEHLAAGGELSDEAFARLIATAQDNVESTAAGEAEADSTDIAAETRLDDERPPMADDFAATDEIDVNVDPLMDVAGNSGEVGVPVPSPNPADPIDYLAWLNERSLTDGPNAGAEFQAALEAFIRWDADQTIHDAAMHGEPEALLSPEITAWLDDNRATMDHFRAATQYEFNGYQRESTDGSMIGILLPELSSKRGIAKMMTIQGKRLELEGRVDEALAVYSDTLAAGAQISRGPTLIENLVGVAIQSLSSTSVLDSFEGPAADAIDYVALAERLQNDFQPARSMAETLQFERAMMFDVVQRAFAWDDARNQYIVSPDGLAQVVSMLGSGDDPAAVIGMGMMLGAIGYERTVEDANAHYDMLTEGFAAPYPEGRAILEEAGRQIAESVSRGPFGGGNPLLNQLLPALSRAYAVGKRSEAQRRATLLTTNIMAYRQQFGTLPASLDAFGTREFTVDPFTEQRFIYRRDGENFTLYSVGENGQDDGGIHDRFGRTNDTVFWPRPKRDN